MIIQHNKYKIISSKNREGVYTSHEKLSRKQIRIQYAQIATEAVQQALWNHIYTMILPKICHYSKKKQDKICEALCKHFEGQAFVIFKQKEPQILAEALSST